MAIKAEEVVLFVRKLLILSIRRIHRSARRHPILLCLGVLLFILSRAFPSTFGFLFSSAPVIICTALLLGVILSHGDTNLPEIDKEDGEASEKISSFKGETSSAAVSSSKNDIAELAAEKSTGIERMAAAGGGHLSRGNGRSVDTQIDSSLDVQSDMAESFSRDASLADIVPMLDEIHPLLHSEPPHPAPISKDDSDDGLEVSSQDPQTDDGSGDESEKQEVENKGAEQRNDETGEVAVLWTADDQKNLVDLGCSELERNRRLENLMAKRRSKPNIILELDSNRSEQSTDDLSCFRVQIPPISVPRENPFGLPSDLDEPLSAPSILLPGRNVFDLPYDQPSESSILPREVWTPREFMSSSHRDSFYTRHETFNWASSELRQERRSSRFKPYFVAETVDLEEGGSSSAYRRQFSDKSESKLSSVLESDTVSSATDQEYHKHDDELAEHGSQWSDGINSLSVQLDDIDTIDDGDFSSHNMAMEETQQGDEFFGSYAGEDPLSELHVMRQSSVLELLTDDRFVSMPEADLKIGKNRQETIDPPKAIVSEVDTLLNPSIGDLEQTVFNPRWHVLGAISIEETNPLLAKADSEMLAVEAKSIEDIDSAFIQVGEDNDESSAADHVVSPVLLGAMDVEPTKITERTEIEPGMVDVEAESVLDITSAFRLIGGGLGGSSSLPGVGASKVLPGGVDLAPTEISDPSKTGSGMAVVEAKSIKDLDSALLQVLDGRVDLRPADISQLTKIDSGKAVVEIKFTDNLDSAFSQVLHGGVDMEPADVLELTKTDSGMAVVEAKSIDDLDLVFSPTGRGGVNLEPSDISELTKTDSGMAVVEAKTMGDLDSAFSQALHGRVDLEPADISELTKTDSGMVVVEAESIKDLYSAFSQVLHGRVGLEPEDIPKLAKADSGTAVVEAKSIDDIDSAFPIALHGRVNLKPVDISVLTKTDSGMAVVEAESTEDLDSAFLQVLPRKVDLEPVDILELTKAVSGMAVVEAKSIEDLDLALSQTLHGEVELEAANISELTKTDSGMAVVEAKSIDELDSAVSQALHAKVDLEPADIPELTKTDLGMAVVEAKSIDDLDSAFLQISSGRVGLEPADISELTKTNLETTVVEAKSIHKGY